jgi:L-ribulose-5-phosphate 3-epimerase
MLLGYNTNGMAHHATAEAVRLLAEIGYRSVALTIDHHALPPGGEHTADDIRRLRRLLDELGLRSVVETGARYLLDPRRKHEPTLVSPEAEGRRRRIEFYRHAIRCAAELGSDCVSIWSGARAKGVERDRAWAWLVEGLRQVLDHAAEAGAAVGFEPEPGMFIDTTAGYDELVERLGRDDLRLTLDIGHVHCQDEGPIPEVIRRHAPRLVNVHLEDMRRGVHEHLMPGEGEIDFPPIFRALGDAGYSGGVHVELSRHSHVAPEAARRAYEFFAAMIGEPRI